MGDFARVIWVMSPTSYRAAPPRTEVLRINLHHSAHSVKAHPEYIAHSALIAHSAWDQIGTKSTFAPLRPGWADNLTVRLINGRGQGVQFDPHTGAIRHREVVQLCGSVAINGPAGRDASIPAQFARVAQLVERPPCKRDVVGSTPAPGSALLPSLPSYPWTWGAHAN